jgi:hypothetical protein
MPCPALPCPAQAALGIIANMVCGGLVQSRSAGARPFGYPPRPIEDKSLAEIQKIVRDNDGIKVCHAGGNMKTFS